MVSCSTSSAALFTESSSAPTWALLPRNGSSVGIRTSESPPEIEDHRVPAGRRDIRTEPPQAFATEIRAGVGRRVVHGVDHLLFGDQPLHRSTGDQPVVQALVQPDIRVLQVHQMQPRRRPVQVLPAAEPFEQPQLGRPVQDLRALHRVALEQVQDVRPRFDDVRGARVGIALSTSLATRSR